jgi:hypothetical protein
MSSTRSAGDGAATLVVTVLAIALLVAALLLFGDPQPTAP